MREGSTVTREEMEMNPKRERKLSETKENSGWISTENKEIARVREKCSEEKSEEKGSRAVITCNLNMIIHDY